MNKYLLIVICFIMLFIFVFVQAEKVSADTGKLLSYYDSSDIKKLKKTDKEYKEFISDFEMLKGFFNFYYRKDDGKVLLEIKPDQLDKIFLFSVYRATGDYISDLDSDWMLKSYPVYFKRDGNKIKLYKKELIFSSNDKSIKRAAERNSSDLLLESAEVRAVNSENGTILIDPFWLFVRDVENISADKKVSMARTNSFFNKPKNFPKNSEITVSLNFVSKKNENENFNIGYNISLSALPESGFQPRLHDDRIGYFNTIVTDLNDVITYDRKIRYINRWNLEKQDPNAPFSAPKKPIEIWIANTVPEKYRDAVRQGLLLWNKAFEKIGIKDAIVVKQQPDNADWDPSDIRYNTISFIYNPISSYAAAPSQVNPFTGEIYAADVLVSFEYINAMYKEAIHFNKLKSEALLQKYVMDFVVSLVEHEFGHTLGIRHNFKGSLYRTSEGNFGSIMDYTPSDFSRKIGGHYWQTDLGPYDYFVIEYGYKIINAPSPEAEKAELEKTIHKFLASNIPYGTDILQNSDPSCSLDDADYPLNFCKILTEQGSGLWNDLEEDSKKTDMLYTQLSDKFIKGIKLYSQAAKLAAKYIGGTYYRNGHIADLGAKLPEEPVPAKEQKEALRFLSEKIFSSAPFNIKPEVLCKLVSDYPGKTFYSVIMGVETIQNSALDKILSHGTLWAIERNEKKYKTDPFKLGDLFDTLDKSIWREMETGENIDIYRRNLQNTYAGRLFDIINNPEDMPADALAAARTSLVKTKNKIAVCLKTSAGKNILDRETKAHLEFILAQINENLNPKKR